VATTDFDCARIILNTQFWAFQSIFTKNGVLSPQRNNALQNLQLLSFNYMVREAKNFISFAYAQVALALTIVASTTFTQPLKNFSPIWLK